MVVVKLTAKSLDMDRDNQKNLQTCIPHITAHGDFQNTLCM